MAGLNGHCFCGAVRIATSAEPFQVSWCHCKDCRRQTGAPAVVWAGFRIGEITFDRAPKQRKSSEHVVRSFCAECGTPIGYEHDELKGEVYIHAGLFDDADRLVPDRHGYVTSKLFWMHLDDGLAKFDDTTRDRS